jgi:hypothetical protein
MWNLTGYPSGVLPVTNVKANELNFEDDYNDAWTRAMN